MVMQDELVNTAQSEHWHAQLLKHGIPSELVTPEKGNHYKVTITNASVHHHHYYHNHHYHNKHTFTVSDSPHAIQAILSFGTNDDYDIANKVVDFVNKQPKL